MSCRPPTKNAPPPELKKELETAEKDAKRLKEVKGTIYKDGMAIGALEELSKYLRSTGSPMLECTTMNQLARDNQFKRAPATYDDLLHTLKKALEANSGGITTSKIVQQLSGKALPDLSEYRTKDQRDLSDSFEKLAAAITAFQKVQRTEFQEMSIFRCRSCASWQGHFGERPTLVTLCGSSACSGSHAKWVLTKTRAGVAGQCVFFWRTWPHQPHLDVPGS